MLIAEALARGFTLTGIDGKLYYKYWMNMMNGNWI